MTFQRQTPLDPVVISSLSNPWAWHLRRRLGADIPGRTSSACFPWGYGNGPASGSHCPSHHSQIWGQCHQRWCLPQEKGKPPGVHALEPRLSPLPFSCVLYVLQKVSAQFKFSPQRRMNDSNLAKACGFRFLEWVQWRHVIHSISPSCRAGQALSHDLKSFQLSRQRNKREKWATILTCSKDRNRRREKNIH